MSDFYVSLPSHSSKSEFLDNKANHFKIRLPHPIRLNGSGGWKVGMSGIAMPDAHVTLPSLSSAKDKVTLAYYGWRRIEVSTRYTPGAAYFDTDDVKDIFHNVDGIGFMKSMIAYFEKRRIFNNSGPKMGAKYVTNDGKRAYIKFKWEGDELVTDNENTLRPQSIDFPALHINTELSERMGWIKKIGSGYELGPNLQMEFFKDEIPDLAYMLLHADVKDKDGVPVFWDVSVYSHGQGYLKLGINCN